MVFDDVLTGRHGYETNVFARKEARGRNVKDAGKGTLRSAGQEQRESWILATAQMIAHKVHTYV